MTHFIITAIVVLAATKADAQTKDNLTKPKRKEKFEGKREVVT